MDRSSSTTYDLTDEDGHIDVYLNFTDAWNDLAEGLKVRRALQVTITRLYYCKKPNEKSKGSEVFDERNATTSWYMRSMRSCGRLQDA
jgi:hypothetical protein